MKKIIILVILLLSLSGCYDYQEINNLAFVSAIGIDYIDDNYKITLEILDDQEKDITTYLKTGEDKVLSKAIENAASKISKQSNYSHTKIAILSESVIKNKLSDITDFFLRSTYFRENFYVVSSIYHSPESILKNTTEENPVASVAIVELLESNKYAGNYSVLKTFDKVIDEIISYGIDTCFSNIKLNESGFSVDGLSVFNDYNYVGLLKNEDATLYNILINQFYRPNFSKDYDDKHFSVAVATGKINIDMKKHIILSGTLHAKVIDNEPSFDIKSLDTLKMINSDFADMLGEKFKDFISTLQNLNSDILGITQKHYQKTRDKNKMLWKELSIESQINFDINKKGLIYEVPDEE